MLVFETSLPVRAYIPRRDLVAGHLAPSPTQTTCPYKGDATYWHVHADGEKFPDAAWSYELPLAAAMKIAGHVCFAADGITSSWADGMRRGRPPGGGQPRSSSSPR